MKKSRHRTQRIVRQEPLATRLLSKPLDWWLQLNEAIETVDWENYTSLISIKGAVFCNVALFLSRIITDRSKLKWSSLFSKSANDDDIFEVDYSSNKGIALLLSSIVVLEFGLVAISIFNTLLAVQKTRRYTLIGQQITEKPKTPSCRLVKIPFEGSSVEDTTQEQYQETMSGENDGNSKANESEPFLYAWALDVWDPPTFSLYFFSIFSPINAFGLCFVPISPTLLVLLALVSLILYHLVFYFLTMQIDREIIQKQVFVEYENQVVKPLISVPTHDAMVGTDGSVDFFLPSLDNKFKTRNSHAEAHTPANLQQNFPSQPSASPLLPSQQPTLFTAPVFPSSLRVANAVRRRSGVPEVKLFYHPAGYFTGRSVSEHSGQERETSFSRERRRFNV